MQRIEIIHTTRYTYPAPVEFKQHKLHLRPREGHDLRIESSKLSISPSYNINWQRDVYGNSVAIVNFNDKSDTLEIVSTLIVEHYESAIAKLELSDTGLKFPFIYEPIEQIDLVPCQTQIFQETPKIFTEWLHSIWTPGTEIETMSLLNALNQRISNDFEYIVRDEPGVQSPDETLSTGKGSCRDLATLFIESCRQFELASRFVSGYLVSNAAVEDVATTHAWSEVYLPGAGWRGFDSTSGQLVGGDHIAVAVHRHPEAIPPVSGLFVGPAKPRPKMQVQVEVLQLQN
jgi:transglutaminase-like putative cysteine protease